VRRSFPLFIMTGMVLLALPVFAQTPNPKVLMETNLGAMTVELYPSKAPGTVQNFLDYVSSQFYDHTIFHRVIRGFMIQGGGLTVQMVKKPGRPPIANEADNGLKNLKGTLAMARTMAPHSATSQFFINTVDNAFLDHRDKSVKGWGYCVFGKVVKGLPVLDAIEKVQTTVRSGRRDVPVNPVVIQKIVPIPPPAAAPEPDEDSDGGTPASE